MSSSRWTDLERPPLDVRALNRALVDGGVWREIRVVEQIGSTNADLVALARAGEAEGLVLVAEHQTAAKGRLGRRWSAPARSGLTFSMLLRPGDVPAGRWTLLPLLVGVAVARAVSRIGEVEVGLKWPNDLLIGERKLAGVLIERVDSPLGPAMVAGVGLNVSLRESELPVPAATSLALAGAACTDRDPVLRAVLREIARQYMSWRAGGDAPLLADYRAMCGTLQREVRAELPGGAVEHGRAVGIDDTGCLVIETSQGRRTLSAGDVIHLR